MNLPRLVRTVRHLRPVQVYGRLWFHLVRPRVDARPAPPRRVRDGDLQWIDWAWREPSLVRPDRLRFLGEERDCVRPEDWDDPGVPRLWRYNLHYFDDLTALGARDRRAWHRALVTRWMTEQRPGEGTGWEPYPLSLRIVNWIKADLAARPDEALLDAVSEASLATQVRFLAARVERHLLGNHLWANAKALLFAGIYFGGREGDRWRARGTRLLHAELAEQVLADGGHYERSPMYHATLLEDVLDLIALARVYPAEFPAPLGAALAAVAPRMLHWLDVMTHPDGGIAFFNDAALGVAAPVEALRAYAAALGVVSPRVGSEAVIVLAESGYARLQNARAVLLCDVAPLGPDCQPAHGHADTLSFELSVDERRVIVNGGTSRYDEGGERARQRGTAAHNTVVVDGADSSEVWGAFRVGRRARARLEGHGVTNGAAWLEGSHDGYVHLRGRVTHRRRWALTAQGLEVTDRLDGRYDSAHAHLHLAPPAEAVVDGDGIVVRGPFVGEVRIAADSAVPERSTGTWHPRFGAAIPATSLAYPVRDGALTVTLRW